VASVIIRLKGGLGNQLFIYSFGLHLATQLQYQLKIDPVSGFINDPYKRDFELEKYGFINENQISKFRFSFWKKLDRKLQSITGLRLTNTIYINEDTMIKKDQFKINDLPFSKDIFVEGYFQKTELVSFALPILSTLYGKKTKSLKSKFRKHKTKSKVSVAVHVREFQKEDTLLLLDYYKRSIDHLSKQIPELEFHIFAKKNVHNNIKNLFTNYAHFFHTPDENDFLTMGGFDHIITANSTFSWWVAALAYSGKGIIIMPKSIRHKAAGNWNSENLLLPGSIVIDV
jgi:hypothetical protein